jgi:hypothetical protein
MLMAEVLMGRDNVDSIYYQPGDYYIIPGIHLVTVQF